jgi:hypothetical protein
MKYYLATSLLLICLTSLGQNDFQIDSLNAVRSIRNFIKSNNETTKNDSIYLKVGNVFQEAIIHKFIRLSNISGTYIQVYSVKDEFQEPIFSSYIHWINYVSDTIFDINGDNTLDLAILWSPAAGCCVRDIYNCFIYHKEIDSFGEEIEIFNPTFYPKDSVTFSMDYNHPGETMFYRLKWSGNNLDTLNSYSWNNKDQQFIIITDYKTGQITESLEIPRELNSLNGIDWFKMKPNKKNE